MKTMKKYLLLLAAIAMLFTLTACGETGGLAGAVEQSFLRETPVLPEEPSAITEEAPASEVPAEEPAVSYDDIYTIEESGHQVQIACPEGWYVDEVEYDSLSITRDDWMAMGYYLMFDTGDKDTFVTLIEQDVIQLYIDDGIYVDHGFGAQVRGMHTMWLTTSDGYNMYFAFGDAYGGWLYVDVIDATGADLETALTELLDAIIPVGDAI